MKILIENLGVLRKAQFELSDLTIICGHNNTGKTYATYAVFGFLSNWHRLMRAEVSDTEISQLISDGVIRIDITSYIMNSQNILSEGCRRYSEQLHTIFASSSKSFTNTNFQVELESDLSSAFAASFERKLRSQQSELLMLSKSEGSDVLEVSLSTEGEKIKLPSSIIEDVISEAIIEIIFGNYFPSPFIASAERTGVSIFIKELDFARNRLVHEIGRAEKEIDNQDMFLDSYSDYALPVRANLDFTRRLGEIAKEESFIAQKHPHILDKFADIIGGEFLSGTNKSIYFKPRDNGITLTMGESSGVVRSMLDVGFYLRHIAKPGDLLMVDEPELSLHPENQCKVACLFAWLVNLGIQVFITTHSDYIIREFNTLIMLYQEEPFLKQIATREGYSCEELIDKKLVKAYVAERDKRQPKHHTTRNINHTLIAADISYEQGIDARSFDKTIVRMNEIQEAILWRDGE